MVAAHKDVLAVIYHGICRRIKKRSRPASQIGFLLEQVDTATRFGQRNTRGETCKAAANDKNLFHKYRSQVLGVRCQETDITGV